MYVNEAMEYAINQDNNRKIVAGKLGISTAMVSHYLNRDNTPIVLITKSKIIGIKNRDLSPKVVKTPLGRTSSQIVYSSVSRKPITKTEIIEPIEPQ